MGNFIQKLQSLPEFDKKVLFYGILGLAILMLGAFEVRRTMYNIGKIKESFEVINLSAASQFSENTPDTNNE